MAGKDAVSKKISILKQENPNMSQGQIIAMALSATGKSKKK